MDKVIYRPHLVKEVPAGTQTVISVLARQMKLSNEECIAYLNAPRPQKGYKSDPTLVKAFRSGFSEFAANAMKKRGLGINTPGISSVAAVKLAVPCYEEKPLGAMIPDVPPPDTGNSSISDILHLVNVQWAAMGVNDLRKKPACLYACEKLPSATGFENFSPLDGPLPSARDPEEAERLSESLVAAAQEGKPLYCGFNGVHILNPRHLPEVLSGTDVVWGTFFDTDRMQGPSGNRGERIGRRFMDYAQSLPHDWSQLRVGDTYINVPNMTRDKFYEIAGPLGWAQCMPASVFLEGETMKENPRWIAVAQRSELEALFVFRVSKTYRPWDVFGTRVPAVEWMRYDPTPAERMSMLSATPPRPPDNPRAYRHYGHYGVRGIPTEVHDGSVVATATGKAAIMLLVPGWAYLRVDWDGEEEYFRTPYRDNNDPCKHRLSVLVSTPDKVTFKVRPVDVENHRSGSFAARLDYLDEMRLRSPQLRVLLGPHVWQPGLSEIEDIRRLSQQFMAANHWWYAGEGRVMLFSPSHLFEWGNRSDNPLTSDLGFLGNRDFNKAIEAISDPSPKGVAMVTPAAVDHIACYRLVRGEVISEMIRSAYDGRAEALYHAIGAVGTDGTEPLAQRCKQKGLLEQLCLTRIIADGARVRKINDLEGFVIMEPGWTRRAPDMVPSPAASPPEDVAASEAAKETLVEEAFADLD